MNSYARDDADRAVEIHQELARVEGIGAPYGDTSGDTEGAVHPSVEDSAAVGLDVEFRHAVRRHQGVWLQTKSWAISMCHHDTGAAGSRGVADSKGDNSRTVATGEILSALLQLPTLSQAKFLEAGGSEHLTDTLDGMERRGAMVYKVNKFFSFLFHRK